MGNSNPFEDPPELGPPAPPAYTPHDAAAASSSSFSSSSAHRPEAQAPREPFSMSTSTTPYPTSRDSTNQKLYAISSWGEIASKGPGIPCIVLHNGPGADDAVMAVSCEEKNWTHQSRSLDGVMVLPPLDAPSSGKTMEREPEPVTELLRCVTSSRHPAVSFAFSIEVPRPDGDVASRRLRRKDFEWRRIQSKERLDGYSNGFELFHAKPEQGSEVGGSEGESETEVLAIVLFKGTLNVNKPFKFEFKGKSLTGELGDRWAVVALMIRIWFLFFPRRAK